MTCPLSLWLSQERTALDDSSCEVFVVSSSGALPKWSPLPSDKSGCAEKMSGPSLNFALQSVAGLLWWVAVWLSPGFAQQFFDAETMERDRFVFFVPDACLFVIGSGVVAYMGTIHHPRVIQGAWMCVGVVLYATLCCLGLCLVGGPWLPVLVMGLATLGTGWSARRIGLQKSTGEKV